MRSRPWRGRRRGDVLVPLLLVLSAALFAAAGLSDEPGPAENRVRSPSPGSVPGAESMLADQILITELLANPTSPEPDGEWIEIFSTYSVTISIAGWRFIDNSASGPTIPPATSIDPGQVWIAANNAVDFQTRFGFAPDFEYGGSALLLANTGDRLGLFDSAMTLVRHGQLLRQLHALPRDLAVDPPACLQRCSKPLQVVVGGIVPKSQVDFLKDLGVGAVFPPGSNLEDIVGYIKAHRRERA